MEGRASLESAAAGSCLRRGGMLPVEGYEAARAVGWEAARDRVSGGGQAEGVAAACYEPATLRERERWGRRRRRTAGGQTKHMRIIFMNVTM